MTNNPFVRPDPPQGWRKVTGTLKGYFPGVFGRKAPTSWLIAVLSFVIGAWLSLDTPHIRDATLRVSPSSFKTRELDIWIVLFWALAIIWMISLAIRLLDDDDAEVEKQRETLKAILKAPPWVIASYGQSYFKSTYEAMLATAPAPDDTPETRLKALENGIQGALKAIATLAADFAGGDSSKYGANIMLAAMASPEHPRFSKPLTDSLCFHGDVGLDSLQAILYMPAELCLPSAGDGPAERAIPVISLPVPQVKESRGFTLYLPGAPEAFLLGDASIVHDTSKLAQDEKYKHLPAHVRAEMVEYFGKGGKGEQVRSFASVRIGEKGSNPVGVLNIDASTPDMLDYHQLFPSFLSLLDPLLMLLAGPVGEYARLRAERHVLYGQDSEISVSVTAGTTTSEAVGVGLNGAEGSSTGLTPTVPSTTWPIARNLL